MTATTETTETKFTIESITLKIQGLLAKANDPAATPAEAEMFAAKAEELMAKYRIEQEHLRETGEAAATAMNPEWSEADLGSARSEWASYYFTFASEAARHTGVRIRVYYSEGNYRAKVLGFAHDVAFFNMLYTSILEAFSAKLEPRFSVKESAGANALRLRQGGMERGRIAQAMGFTKPEDTLNEQKAANRKVTKLIKEEAEHIGQPHLAEEVLGRQFNAKTYRRSYAQGFLDQLYHRLMTLALANTEGGLVLKRTKEAVDEMWYERYPSDRPKPAKPEDYKPCEKCAKAKSGSCRDHSFRAGKSQPLNWKAVEKGRSAARSADLGSAKANRLN